MANAANIQLAEVGYQLPFIPADVDREPAPAVYMTPDTTRLNPLPGVEEMYEIQLFNARQFLKTASHQYPAQRLTRHGFIPVERRKTVTTETLTRQLKGKNPPRVIDVRTGIEFRSGHIPGALHLPTSKLIFSRRQLPRDKSSLLVITCEHGPRAALAKGLLGLFGYRNCELLAGHMHAYRKKKLPLEK